MNNKILVALSLIFIMFMSMYLGYKIPKKEPVSDCNLTIQNSMFVQNKELIAEVNYLKNTNLELIEKNEDLVELWNECNLAR